MEKQLHYLFTPDVAKRMRVGQDKAIKYLHESWKDLALFEPYPSITELTRQRHYHVVRASCAVFKLSRILQNKDVFKCIAKDMLQPSYTRNPAWGEPLDWKFERNCSYYVTGAIILWLILMWIYILFKGIK